MNHRYLFVLIACLLLVGSVSALTEWTYSTATASSTYTTRYPTNLIDHNLSTIWDGYPISANNAWAQIDYGAGNSYPVSYYAIYGYADPGSYFTDWRFLGTNDGVTFTLLDSETGQMAGKTTTWSNFTVSQTGNVSNFRYYRVAFSAFTDGEPMLGEINLLGSQPAPVAAFSINTTGGNAPVNVGTTDTSTNTPTSWAYGAKNITPGNNTWITVGTSQNSAFVLGVGNWSINLTATNIGGSNISTYTPWVNVSPFVLPSQIVANFTATPLNPAVYASVAFTDTSTGSPPTKWSWDFGDGSTSSVQNPSYAYTTTGLKTVTLTASLLSNTSNNNTVVKTNYINVTSAPPPAPVASFTGTPTLVLVAMPVQFNDTSTNTPTSWSWDFGDSTGSSLQNPSHAYAALGLKTVSLTATNPQGSNVSTRTNYINVTTVLPSVSGFNRVDLTMSQQYLFTLNIVDTNGNPIPAVLVSDSNGYNATTTNGVFTYQYPYSVVVFYLSSAGYASKSVSYIISDNTTETVVMTAVTTTSQNANVIFSPRSVAIQVLDANYNPIVNDPVYVNAYSSSLPGGLAGAVGYFKTTYGVAESTAQSMLAANTTYYGTTDDYGFVAIQVADIIQYQIITKDTNGVNTSRLMWPSGPYYQIVTGTAVVAGIAAQGRSQANINRNSTFNTTFWEPNTTYSCMGINVYDSTGQTNNVYAWWKLVDNGTVWWTNATAIGGYGPINSTKCVLHVPYQQWKWGGITG